MINNEICPSCGEFFKELIPETGWCVECTKESGIEADVGSKLYRRIEAYLAINADEIEHYLLQGLSFNRAIGKLHRNNGRPHCLSCGKLMRRAPRTAVFCRSTPQCRRFSRRYVYLYRERKMTKSEALAIVLEELT